MSGTDMSTAMQAIVMNFFTVTEPCSGRVFSPLVATPSLEVFKSRAKKVDRVDHTNTNTNKIYIAPGILKRIGAQTHGVTRR